MLLTTFRLFHRLAGWARDVGGTLQGFAGLMTLGRK